MSRRETTITLCDLDGQWAAPVQFAIGGQAYEADLCTPHKEQMRATLAPYLAAARPQQQAPRYKPGRSPADRKAAAAMRAWARGRGYVVSGRGRLAADIVAAYRAANGGAK